MSVCKARGAVASILTAVLFVLYTPRLIADEFQSPDQTTRRGEDNPLAAEAHAKQQEARAARDSAVSKGAPAIVADWKAADSLWDKANRLYENSDYKACIAVYQEAIAAFKLAIDESELSAKRTAAKAAYFKAMESYERGVLERFGGKELENTQRLVATAEKADDGVAIDFYLQAARMLNAHRVEIHFRKVAFLRKENKQLEALSLLDLLRERFDIDEREQLGELLSEVLLAEPAVLIRRAEKNVPQIGDDALLLSAWSILAESYQELGMTIDSREALRKLKTHAETFVDNSESFTRLLELAAMQYKLADRNGAIQTVADAELYASAYTSPRDQVYAYAKLAGLSVRYGDSARWTGYMRKAAAPIQKLHDTKRGYLADYYPCVAYSMSVSPVEAIAAVRAIERKGRSFNRRRNDAEWLAPGFGWSTIAASKKQPLPAKLYRESYLSTIAYNVANHHYVGTQRQLADADAFAGRIVMARVGNASVPDASLRDANYVRMIEHLVAAGQMQEATKLLNRMSVDEHKLRAVAILSGGEQATSDRVLDAYQEILSIKSPSMQLARYAGLAVALNRGLQPANQSPADERSGNVSAENAPSWLKEANGKTEELIAAREDSQGDETILWSLLARAAHTAGDVAIYATAVERAHMSIADRWEGLMDSRRVERSYKGDFKWRSDYRTQKKEFPIVNGIRKDGFFLLDTLELARDRERAIETILLLARITEIPHDRALNMGGSVHFESQGYWFARLSGRATRYREAKHAELLLLAGQNTIGSRYGGAFEYLKGLAAFEAGSTELVRSSIAMLRSQSGDRREKYSASLSAHLAAEHGRLGDAQGFRQAAVLVSSVHGEKRSADYLLTALGAARLGQEGLSRKHSSRGGQDTSIEAEVSHALITFHLSKGDLNKADALAESITDARIRSRGWFEIGAAMAAGRTESTQDLIDRRDKLTLLLDKVAFSAGVASVLAR